MDVKMRLTIVNVKVPFLRRLLALFNGELVLAVMGNVQDVAVISRSDAQQIMDSQHTKKWVPYQNHAAPPPSPKGPPRVQDFPRLG